MKTALALVVVLGLASTALADDVSPGDELCTVDAQSRDGARCEECRIARTRWR